MRGVWRLIFAAALFCMFGFGSLAAAEKRPPNIVVFLVDDLGATDLGCFGSTFYETPNVDRLAAGGMRFRAAYSTCPVCSPTRASMMTGRYPQRTGITDYINVGRGNQPEGWTRNTQLLPASYSDHLALDERTIAEELRDAGYATFFAGKWHLGGKGFLPTDQGFQINKGGTDAGSPRSYFSPYKNALLPEGPPGESLPLRLADETCKFIGANREQPFFAYLSFYSVHIPLQATKEGIAKYEAKAARLPADTAEFGREHDSKWRLVQKPERALYWDYPHYGNQGGLPASAVREGKWKLIEWREDGALELFDLEADPGEQHNLAKTQAEIATRLEGKLAAWRREVGAKSPTPNPKYRSGLQ